MDGSFGAFLAISVLMIVIPGARGPRAPSRHGTVGDRSLMLTS